jgi:hypothetical protein
MSYQVDPSIEARHTMARLPVGVRQFAREQLENLARDPTSL